MWREAAESVIDVQSSWVPTKVEVDKRVVWPLQAAEVMAALTAAHAALRFLFAAFAAPSAHEVLQSRGAFSNCELQPLPAHVPHLRRVEYPSFPQGLSPVVSECMLQRMCVLGAAGLELVASCLGYF